MPTCCKWLIYMDRTGLGRTALPVCGQHRTAGAHCQQTLRCRSPPPASARAELVNRARDDFLASPGLARHQTVALVDATACTSARMDRRPPRCPAMAFRKRICVRSGLRAISLSIGQRAVVLIPQRVLQNLTVRSYFTPPFADKNRANKRPGLGRSQLIPGVVLTRKTCVAVKTFQATLLTEHRKLRQHCRSAIQAISYVRASFTSANACRSQCEKTLVS